MKLSKNDLDKIAKSITTDLLCCCGLKNAKKVAIQVKRNLKAEQIRRNLKIEEGKRRKKVG